MLTALVVVVVAELTFGISGQYSEALGRGAGLSGRTVLWTNLLQMHFNRVLGTGFESFWLGERLKELEGIFFYIPNEAHNGYLETYLTLGIIGVLLLVGLFISTFRKIRLELFRNFEWGRYRLGFLAAVVLYNWTEAAFKTVNPIWFIFYLIAMDYPQIRSTAMESSDSIARTEDDMELVYVEGKP